MPEKSEKKDAVKTFKLEEDLTEQIDEMAKKSGRTKDGEIRYLIREGIKAHLNKEHLEERLSRVEEQLQAYGELNKPAKDGPTKEKRRANDRQH